MGGRGRYLGGGGQHLVRGAPHRIHQLLVLLAAPGALPPSMSDTPTAFNFHKQLDAPNVFVPNKEL